VNGFLSHSVYCRLKVMCLSVQVIVKKGEVESKMLSGLLTGVNRAYPYAKGKSALSAM